MTEAAVRAVVDGHEDQQITVVIDDTTEFTGDWGWATAGSLPGSNLDVEDENAVAGLAIPKPANQSTQYGTTSRAYIPWRDIKSVELI